MRYMQSGSEAKLAARRVRLYVTNFECPFLPNRTGQAEEEREYCDATCLLDNHASSSGGLSELTYSAYRSAFAASRLFTVNVINLTCDE
jgi:hypothetical protein